MNQKFSMQTYIGRVAGELRRREAEMHRGNIARLEALEQTSDRGLICKWGWISSACGAVFSFLVLPIFIGIFQSLVPGWACLLLWSFAKVSMALVLLMFLVSLYFTIASKD